MTKAPLALPDGYRPLRSWDGDASGTRRSPNFGPRRSVTAPDMVVIHYTAMTSAYAACNTLCNPETEVSAHYLIDESGEVISLVDEKDRAWHAGAGCWGQVTDVNSHSIGIELANPGNCPFAAEQMDALTDVLLGIQSRWNIQPERIIGHSDMAPGRKIDPGPRFDWRRLALQRLAIWPARLSGPAAPVAQFRDLMQTLGYTADVDDATLLHSLRLRFRPGAAGPLDQHDMAILADLAARFPVDGPAPTA